MVEREYDEKGRLVREVVTHDAEWTSEDLALAKAHRRNRLDECPGCRLPLSETTAMHDGEPAHSYQVPDPARCHACDARLKRQEEHAKQGTIRSDALLWWVERRRQA